MKIFSQQKYDDNKRQEYLDKKQREEEETRRAHRDKMNRKQEYRDRKQESGEDSREYYATKEKLWFQAYTPNKSSLVELKDRMLKGLYDAELKETCLLFMQGTKTKRRD